jgi:hypothetical protein
MADKTVEVEEVNGQIVVTITGEQYDKPPTIITESNGQRVNHPTAGTANKEKTQGVFKANAAILAGGGRMVTLECSGRVFVVTIPANGMRVEATEKVR